MRLINLPNAALLAFLPLFAPIFTSCGTPKRPQMPKLHITVVQATEKTLPTTLSFVGQTHSLFDIKIQPRISGYLKSINFSEGMPVKKGQLLFQIDKEPASLQLSQAEAQLASAKAQLVETQNNYDRSVPLARINAVSKSSLDQATASLASAKANLQSAQAAFRSAQLNLSYASIYAPSDGVIGMTDAQVGDFVGVGTQYQVLNTLSNIDSIYVYLSIPMARYLEIVDRDSLNQPVFDDKKLLSDIKLTFADGTVYGEQGVYKFTQRAIDNTTGTVVLNVLFANPNRTLKPGEFVRVTANVGREQKRVVIPQQAVVQSQGGNSVFVMDKDSTVQYRKVTLGQTVGALWSVIDGLQNGEVVLTDGLQKVRSGMKISPVYQTVSHIK